MKTTTAQRRQRALELKHLREAYRAVIGRAAWGRPLPWAPRRIYDVLAVQQDPPGAH